MCILFCYLHDQTVQLGYDLILLSNRDEDFQRPALPAHLWKDTHFVLGGQDQTSAREGGTWLCMNTVHRKIAVLLNLPSRLLGGKNPQAQSRGFLVPNYVNNAEIDLDSYMEEIQKTKMNYTGFNFLAVERGANTWRAKYVNNIPPSSMPVEMTTSLFGFSNHVYGDQYDFEKTRHGCQLLKKILSDLSDEHSKPISDEKELIRRLFDLLSDQTTFTDDSNLSNTYSHYQTELRNQISSIYVNNGSSAPTYGTRTSTIILVRQDQSGLFIEKTMTDPLVDPTQWSEQIWQFQLNQSTDPPRRLNPQETLKTQ